MKSWLLDKTLMLGKTEDREGGDTGEMIGWYHWQRTCVWANSGRWWKTGKPGVLQYMGSQRVRHDRVTEQQQQILINQLVRIISDTRRCWPTAIAIINKTLFILRVILATEWDSSISFGCNRHRYNFLPGLLYSVPGLWPGCLLIYTRHADQCSLTWKHRNMRPGHHAVHQIPEP